MSINIVPAPVSPPVSGRTTVSGRIAPVGHTRYSRGTPKQGKGAWTHTMLGFDTRPNIAIFAAIPKQGSPIFMFQTRQRRARLLQWKISDAPSNRAKAKLRIPKTGHRARATTHSQRSHPPSLILGRDTLSPTSSIAGHLAWCWLETSFCHGVSQLDRQCLRPFRPLNV